MYSVQEVIKILNKYTPIEWSYYYHHDHSEDELEEHMLMIESDPIEDYESFLNQYFPLSWWPYVEWNLFSKTFQIIHYEKLSIYHRPYNGNLLPQQYQYVRDNLGCSDIHVNDDGITVQGCIDESWLKVFAHKLNVDFISIPTIQLLYDFFKDPFPLYLPANDNEIIKKFKQYINELTPNQQFVIHNISELTWHNHTKNKELKSSIIQTFSDVIMESGNLIQDHLNIYLYDVSIKNIIKIYLGLWNRYIREPISNNPETVNNSLFQSSILMPMKIQLMVETTLLSLLSIPGVINIVIQYLDPPID